MAKGKAKNNSSGKGDAIVPSYGLTVEQNVAPPQLRSLRSRKRVRPSEELSKTDDVQATLHRQDTEGNNLAVDATLLQCDQCPLQESTTISTEQHLDKQDPATEEEHADAEAFEGQGQNTVTNPNIDSQLDGFKEHTDNDANKTGKDREEITAGEYNRSSETHTNQLRVFMPTSEEGDGSCATVLEEQLGSKENSLCYLERNKEISQEEPSSVHMAAVKVMTKEATAGLPAKKKRRMGMCGLTEKERSHYLQTQHRENTLNGPVRVEKQICNNTADPVAQEEIIPSRFLPSSLSIPVGSVAEQSEAEIKRQSSSSGGDDRAETGVHVAVTTSEGTSTVCDGKSCEAEGGTESGPEQTGDAESYPPAEEEEEELLGNREQQQQHEGRTAEIMAEKPQRQMKDGEDGSAVIAQSSAITFHSSPTHNEETEDRNAMEAALLQVNNVAGTRDEKREEFTADAVDSDGAEAGASSTYTLCEATVTPGGSERKDSRDPDDEPGPSTVNSDRPRTGDTSDPFGSGCLDDVSDSQLNTIVLSEEEVMKRQEDLGSRADTEDATDLVCGLIRELSSLNREVMAAHRELENLRRSSKTSRSSIR